MRAISYISSGDRVLDICTGTGRLAIMVSKKVDKNGSVTGIDINDEMLAIARKKVKKNPGNLSFILADSKNIPFEDSLFDAVTVAFGIRNISEPEKALKECYRLLKKGGRFICLELMKPESPFFRPLWRFYVFKIVPFIGMMVTGDPLPYRYLPSSIEGFYSVQEFSEVLKNCGFHHIKLHRLTCGTANIFVAEKGFKE